MNFKEETINDNKLCKREYFKESLNFSNESNLKSDKDCNLKLSESNAFDPGDTSNLKEGGGKIFESELFFEGGGSRNEAVIKTQIEERTKR